MPDLFTFDYAVIRVVPRVEREEFMNVGVVLFCATQKFLKARIELDSQRLTAFSPTIDQQIVAEYLFTIPLICEGGAQAGPVGLLEPRARFHWLVAPRSTIIQCSAVHSGVCHDLENAIDHLVNEMVKLPLPAQT